jgi:hypothetical protein
LVVLVVCVALLGCATDQHRYDAAMDPVNLVIPDRQWDPKRPDPSVGWCAETCIQMAIGYYGQEVSQKQINQAGAPRHPDLYAYDIDNALNALGVSFICFDESNSDLSAFIVWIRDNLRCGGPVICGCKLYPDEHPDWNLDHFVLVVGCNAEGLLLNTQLDMGGQLLVPYGRLASNRSRYSFKNRRERFFGRAITGLRR